MMRYLVRHHHALCLGLFLLLSGCAGNYHDAMSPVHRAVQSGQYEEADRLLNREPEIADGNARLLYLLDKGMIAHLEGRYADSNRHFEQAARQFDALDYVSATGTAAEWTISELGQPYRGEDFERVIVHYYMALNYLMLEEWDEALVECRRVNTLLRELNGRYEQKNVYTTDAFMLYLSGLIYEAMGATNDALVDYRNAYETYTTDYAALYGTPLPAGLRENIVRTALALGFDDIAEQYAGPLSLAAVPTQQEFQESARLVIVWDNGLIPYKAQHIYRDVIDLDDDNDDGCYLKFAFPVFVSRPSRFTHATVSIGGQRRQVELVEDLARIAIKNLEDRRLRTLAKAIARNVLKCAAEHQLRREHEALGWLFALLTEVTEQADTRSWLLLPGTIHMTEMLVPPGTADVTVAFSSPYGPGMAQVKTVTLEAGQTTFLIHRTF